MNEIELLFTEMLNCDRLSLYLNSGLKLDKEKSYLISGALKKRIAGEPIQYILGKTEFMGLELKLNQDVFIPRPETELLVETTIKYVTRHPSPVTSLRILDIGTGSGCIAVSLAKLLPGAKLTATDISQEALEVARYNAVLNKVAEKIRFIESNLFARYTVRRTRYDMILSNPPYISTSEIEKLQIEVQYEPRIALDGGADGLGFYRRIIKDAHHYLKHGGYLIMEIGYNQRAGIEDIFQKEKNFRVIEAIKDYNNIDRVIVAQKHYMG